MAQIKHYVGYDSDSGNTFIDDQTLHEVYVAPFEAAIRRADVSSIMCSYNRLNGTFACGNKDTLTNILRDQIGFKGFVTSDWGAVHAVNFINAGLDMEMPGGQPGPMGSFIPSFFDSLPPPPPLHMTPKPRPNSMKPCSAATFLKSRHRIAMGCRRLRRQAQSRKNARSPQGRHRH